MERSTSLHAIGAALFFRRMLPMANTNEEKAGYVLTVSGAENRILDMRKLSAEIADLRKSLDEYRTVLQRLVSDEELLRLSSRARRETQSPSVRSRRNRE
jgi:hypothetical protein